MSTVLRSTNQLIDGLLDKGIPFVGSYLEKTINRNIIIADSNGVIHFPVMTDKEELNTKMLVKIPSSWRKGRYIYQEKDGFLFYMIKCNYAMAYIIIKNLAPTIVYSAIALLDEIKPVIKCYFFNYYKITADKEKFEKEFSKYLFSQSKMNIRDIIKLSDRYIDIHVSYYVSLIKIEGLENTINWGKILQYTNDFFNNIEKESIVLAFSNYLILVIPVHRLNNTYQMDEKINSFKNDLEKEFNCSSSQGVGQPHPLSGIKRSSYEARIALTLPALMGEKNYVQHFSSMGVYSLIFSQSIEALRNYCFLTLGELIENNKPSNKDLLSTLREIFNCNMNYKSAAENLIIHINTLYYRINKIEELLKIDFSCTSVQVNLSIAIKLWDTLKLIQEQLP